MVFSTESLLSIVDSFLQTTGTSRVHAFLQATTMERFKRSLVDEANPVDEQRRMAFQKRKL
jgi:hypothetical protein